MTALTAPTRATLTGLEDRFFAKVQGDDYTQCWLWKAATTPAGYGVIRTAPRDLLYAHRWSWSLFNGPIPDGLHLDHLCRVRTCVNPWHLEPVTPAENHMRGLNGWGGGRCTNGHDVTLPENVGRIAGKTPKRYCRLCDRARKARFEARRESM